MENNIQTLQDMIIDILSGRIIASIKAGLVPLAEEEGFESGFFFSQLDEADFMRRRAPTYILNNRTTLFPNLLRERIVPVVLNMMQESEWLNDVDFVNLNNILV
jgi:hypothetical protein